MELTTTTTIQKTAEQLYADIKTGFSNIKTFANTPNEVLFLTILTKAAKSVENYSKHIKKLSSAEKQSIALEIGRLFVKEVKGEDSIELQAYDIFALPTLEQLISFSNDLVDIGKKIKLNCFSCCKKK